MKDMSNWSIVGLIVGAAFMIFSFCLYYLGYSGYVDRDKTIAYILIGITVIAVSWLYNQNKLKSRKLQEELEKIHRVVDELGAMIVDSKKYEEV